MRKWIVALALASVVAPAGAVGLGPLSLSGTTRTERKGFYLTLINPFARAERVARLRALMRRPYCKASTISATHTTSRNLETRVSIQGSFKVADDPSASRPTQR